VNADQVVIGAIAAVVLILIVVGVGRAISRRRGANEDDFGAGGRRQVPLGTSGVAKTDLSPSGVVLAAGEQWTADSASGARIESGRRVRVVGQRGLTLIVDADPASAPTGE
jgi:membrane-bound ClpP family serine protease